MMMNRARTHSQDKEMDKKQDINKSKFHFLYAHFVPGTELNSLHTPHNSVRIMT